jgi:hypothetical protein
MKLINNDNIRYWIYRTPQKYEIDILYYLLKRAVVYYNSLYKDLDVEEIGVSFTTKEFYKLLGISISANHPKREANYASQVYIACQVMFQHSVSYGKWFECKTLLKSVTSHRGMITFCIWKEPIKKMLDSGLISDTMGIEEFKDICHYPGYKFYTKYPTWIKFLGVDVK